VTARSVGACRYRWLPLSAQAGSAVTSLLGAAVEPHAIAVLAVDRCVYEARSVRVNWRRSLNRQNPPCVPRETCGTPRGGPALPGSPRRMARARRFSSPARALLRPRRHWPRRRAAEQCDEVAAHVHLITSSARARSDGGTSRPRALAVERLTTSPARLPCEHQPPERADRNKRANFSNSEALRSDAAQ
jgi:hypothetical protein